MSSSLTGRDFLAAALLFLAALGTFWFSPIVNVGDSRYTLLLSHSLLTRGSFVLDPYGLPRKPIIRSGDADLDGDSYQLEIVHGHLYNYFPPGSAILSAPFVLLAKAAHYPLVHNNGVYLPGREDALQHAIASLLMAGLAVTFYFTARLLLPPGWSAVVAAGGVLGTQVWSTASRGLWTHTWGIALLGYALYRLLAWETGRQPLRPVLLATVLSWTYFVRPTNAIFIVGITVYLVLCARPWRTWFPAYAATGAAWFAGFVAFSWTHFGKALPSYFAGNRLQTGSFREALAGNLVSPSRGVLVFVPVALFVLYLLARFWPRVPHRRLVTLAAAVTAAHLAAVSCFVPWFGGGCYGPRYTTELVPWFVLLAVLGLRAAVDWRADMAAAAVRPRRREWKMTLAAGAGLLLLSVGIQARGAIDVSTAAWNEHPVSVDLKPARVWSWRYPQILAGLVPFPVPEAFPLLEGRRIDFKNGVGRSFLLDGWSGGDMDYCWTEQRWAKLIFAADDAAAARLRLDFGLYVRPPRLPQQRVLIRLNGQPLTTLTVREDQPQEYDFVFPAGRLQRKNVLTFDLPDATAPAAVGEGDDVRLLGLAMCWIALERIEPVERPK